MSITAPRLVPCLLRGFSCFTARAGDVDPSTSPVEPLGSSTLAAGHDTGSSESYETARVHPSMHVPISSPSEETIGSCDYDATPSPAAAELEKTPCLSMVALPAVKSLRRAGQSNRRCSVASGSSGTSSLRSIRWKERGGDPFSRARTMARFVRQARTIRAPPVFIVDPHHLASLEFVDSDEDSDDEWSDEQIVRIVV